MEDETPMQVAIAEACDEVKRLLLLKNREYGDSARSPIGIFSGLDPEMQLNVRIDDKLKRIQTTRLRGRAIIHEDTELDLIGYLILRRAIRAMGKAA